MTNEMVLELKRTQRSSVETQWELFRWINTLHRHDWRNDKPECPAQAEIIVKVGLSKRNSALPKMMSAYGRDPCADLWVLIV